MTDTTALDILKNAILLERRGKAFYTRVADQASAQAVKDFFSMMADEEDKHVAVLSEQYQAYRGTGVFAAGNWGEKASAGFSSEILSERLKREISAADFEAAAIAAALSMERNAVRFYGERAAAATDPQEKALYQWLSDWETEHLEFLSKVDREVIEEIWNDAHFWPM
ncbi:MAG: ferritin family protein [Deltaproteobacteria bacterium]|nr:ferritin family protein [Deltaproteobacteria bacterium]